MTPSKRHCGGAAAVVQFIGLAILIGFIYRHFGPDASSTATPSVIAVLVAGMILVPWPISLKGRQ
jgi:hypothetical protein